MVSRKGRKRGAVVTYSPTQAQRYKSQWVRYQKSIGLFPDSIQQQDNKAIYFYKSDRSNSGYWEVSYEEGTQEEDLTIRGIYYLGWYFRGAFIDGEYSNFPTDAPGVFGANPLDTVLDEIDVSGGGGTSNPAPYLLTANYPIQLRAVDSFAPNPAPENRFTNYDVRVGTGNWARLSGIGAYAGSPPIVVYRFKVINGELVQYFLDGGGYSCTCPDYSRRQDGLLKSRWITEQYDRDWSNRNAGATGDCKHIYATRLARGDLTELPLDFPLTDPDFGKRKPRNPNYPNLKQPRKPRGK